MINLGEKLEKALISVGFLDKYAELVSAFPSENERLRVVDIDEVKSILFDCGFESCAYHRKESFFEVDSQVTSSGEILFKVALTSGMVEFMMYHKYEETVFGAPYHVIARLLDPEKRRYQLPVFGNYDELAKIIRLGSALYHSVMDCVKANE